jgi:hypothetical protein
MLPRITTPSTLHHQYFKLCPKILDQNFVKKANSDVIYDHVIRKYDVITTLQSNLFIL